MNSRTDVQRRFAWYGMLGCGVVGLLIGIMASGPNFHIWPVTTSLCVIVGCGVVGGCIGYGATALVVGSLIQGGGVGAGGEGGGYEGNIHHGLHDGHGHSHGGDDSGSHGDV